MTTPETTTTETTTTEIIVTIGQGYRCHGLFGQDTECGRVVVEDVGNASMWIVSQKDWEEWVDHEDPESFLSEWIDRGETLAFSERLGGLVLECNCDDDDDDDDDATTVPVSAEMYDLAESWEESARGRDPDAVRIAEAAQKGDPVAISQILEFERRDGDPEVAREAEAAQEAIEASVITLTEREEEAHGLTATETEDGRMLIESYLLEDAILVDQEDWEEWVENDNPHSPSNFGRSFWDSWRHRGNKAKWDANCDLWRLA